MSSIHHELASIRDPEKAGQFLQKLQALSIPYSGGRYFIHKEFPGYLCMKQIVLKMQELCKNNSLNAVSIFDKVKTLDQLGDLALSESYWFQKLFTHIKQYFGNWTLPATQRREICERFQNKAEEFICYRASDKSSPIAFRHETEFFVTDQDTLEALNEQRQYYQKPVILDMAHPSSPGGHYKNPDSGCAQEEWLAFRSRGTAFELGTTLEHAKAVRAPGENEEFIPDDGCLYLPTITYFLKANNDHTPDKNSPLMYVATICAAAPDNQSTQPPLDTAEYRTRMKNKIRAILFAAYQNQHDVLILGALGCGMFNNRPSLVSRYFKEVFDEEFKGAFERVVFAIKGRDPDPYDEFLKTFKK